jgi:catechol 2,3-dioxygenase-like lactoylglutathione lyase family enzyme
MIAVRDVVRARDFYSGVLGLSGQEDPRGTGIRFGGPDGGWFLV